MSHFNVRMDSYDRGPVTAQQNVNPYKGYIKVLQYSFPKLCQICNCFDSICFSKMVRLPYVHI